MGTMWWPKPFGLALVSTTLALALASCADEDEGSPRRSSASGDGGPGVDAGKDAASADGATTPDGGPPATGGTFVVGAGETTLRLPAPAAEATMTLAALEAAGGAIAGSNVVVRGGTWAGGPITITGHDVVLTGVTFTSNVGDLIRVTGTAKNVRIHGCTFTRVGSGDGASSYGIIKVDPDPSVTDNGEKQRVAIARNLTIDENVFQEPQNAVLWVNHGNQRIRFSHNHVTGPVFTPSSGDTETETLKLGWSSGFDDDAQSVMAFNTIESYDGRPYTVGFKQSGWSMIGNLLDRRTEMRATNGLRIIGNVIPDGDLHGGGAGHLITKNYVRTSVDRDGFGPVMFYDTCGFPPYDHDGAWFNVALTSSTVKNNTFINDATSNGFAVMLVHAQYATIGGRPQGNTFADNVFVSNVPADHYGSDQIVRLNHDDGFTLQQVFDQNTWSGNRVFSVVSPIGVPPGSATIATGAPAVPTTVTLDRDELPAVFAP